MYAKHIYLSDGEYMVDIQDISNIIFTHIYAKHIHAKPIHANTHPQNHLAAKWGVGSAESEGDSGHLHPCHQVSMMLMLMLITNEDMMMLKMIMPVNCS